MCSKISIAGCLALALNGVIWGADDVRAVLERQTQEMLDATSSGNAAVWDRYVDPMVIYTSEDGTVSTKAQLVEQIKPLPPGASGQLKAVDFQANVLDDVAVATYIADEHENYHGQQLHCQYRITDTWRKAGGQWRLVGSQTLALRNDPPAIALSAQQLSEYVGRYALDSAKIYEIRVKDGHLEGKETGRPAEILKAELPDLLFASGKPRYRRVFQRAADGHIVGFAERREAWDLTWKRLP